MSLIEIFRNVFINIWANKFRAFLTMLGIIVGSATILLVVAVGKGGQKSVEEQFARLNVGTLYIMSNPVQTGGQVLNSKDVEAILEKVSSVKEASISISGKVQAGYYDTSYQASVVGVMEGFKELNNLNLKKGIFINNEDDEQRRKAAVIGYDLAEILFGEEKDDAVGKLIIVNKRKYEVIGVLQRLGDSMQGLNMDESVLVPYTVAEKYILGKDVKPRIIALVSDNKYVKSATQEISDVVNQAHRIKNTDDFVVRDQGSRLAAAQDTARTMSILLISVATIVLIVGGIGIMNVLFVSVKERTREIGILKAIGAKKKDILLHFLLEAVLVSLVGGLMGIMLGSAIVPLTKYIDMETIPSALGIELAFIFSAATGTFFGYYPAAKAAELSPIEALSYE